jgi:hypothetical protein
MLAPRLPSLTDLSHDWSRRQPTDHDLRILCPKRLPKPCSRPPRHRARGRPPPSGPHGAAIPRSLGPLPVPGPPGQCGRFAARLATGGGRHHRPSREAWGAGREPARARRPGRPLNPPGSPAPRPSPPPRSSPRPSSSQIVPPAEAPAGSTRAARWEPDSLRSGQLAVHLHYSTSVLRRIPGPAPRRTIGWGKAVTHKQTNRREALGPFLTVLDGTPVPHAELVAGEGWLRSWSLTAGPSPFAPMTTGPGCGTWSTRQMTRRLPGDAG